jgi:methionyl-tRNA formyltransferase
MRILFIGTSQFAVPTLKALLASEHHQVIGVVTQPDRPSGRGRQLRYAPIKQVALEAGLPIYQPEKVRSEDFVELVREMSPDVIVVAAFGQIIPKSILDVPKYGNVNVHASLLPKYRGAAPVHHALFNGETRTGVTTMLMDPGLDTGPVLLQRDVNIDPEDDEGILEARLAEIGAELLLETLEGLEHGTIVPRPQDDFLATLAPSVKKEDCELDWGQSARALVNRVRGCTPRPGAYASLGGVTLKIWACCVAEPPTDVGVPGDVLAVTPEGIVVRAGEGALLLTEVQPENKRRMPAADFARGYRITPAPPHNQNPYQQP